jgi:hypothetical protein
MEQLLATGQKCCKNTFTLGASDYCTPNPETWDHMLIVPLVAKIVGKKQVDNCFTIAVAQLAEQ